MDDRRDSKQLSYVLRHRPDSIGIALDEAGWVAVPELLAGLRRRGAHWTRERVEHLVRTSDKQRFALDRGGDRIRANQGHSVPVELGLTPSVPPDVLFHGTPVPNVAPIRREGLRRGSRHHVHLSPDAATADRVGSRRGPAAVLRVAAGRMAADGLVLYVTDNGVWLTDAVPPEYLELDEPPSPSEALGPGSGAGNGS